MKLNWNEAIEYCNNLDFAGYQDWRLPTVNELMSLIDWSKYCPSLPTNHPFIELDDYYWSSTVYAFDETDAWYVNMNNGSINYYSKASTDCICPVRDGQYDIQGNLICYGLSKNQSRFIEHTNGTVTDNRTGLMWIMNHGGL